jgi:outer membrane protein assembly factor BamA
MRPAHLITLVAVHLSTALQAQQAPEERPLRILGVSVTGNKVTKESIILRELLVHEGDTLSADVFYERLERSRQNLTNTGLFNTVTLLPVYVDMGSVFVEVRVNERWYLWPAVIFDLADPNFNTWWRTKDLGRVNYGLYLYQYNFRGRNETVYALAQFGYTRQFALRYKVPYVDREQRWGVSAGAGFLQQSEVTAGTVTNERTLIANPEGSNRDEWKADLEVTLRRRHDVRHAWRLNYTDASVTDTIVRTAADYFDGPSTGSRFLALGYTLTWDLRDTRIFPRKGHLAELRVDRLGIGLLSRSAPDITTTYATYKHWWKVHDKWTLGLSARGKYTFGIPPYYVQEGLGYSHFVRGFEYYVIDGEHFALAKGNVIFQLIKPRTSRVEVIPLEAFRTLYFALYLDLFADVGRAWDSRYAEANFLANRWMNGTGIGLDLVTSYDQVVRGEYTLNSLGEHGFFLHFSQPF